MDHDLYHTIFLGIELKITDILMWILNFGIVAFFLGLMLLSAGSKWIESRKGPKTVSIGQLVHLGMFTEHIRIV